MEEVLRSLSGLLLAAIPTFLLVIAIHFYLKYMYFKPMARVLEERREATEGARKVAEESLEKAAEKATQYEAALRAARAEIYHEQEAVRDKLRQEHEEAIREARRQAEEMVKESKQRIGSDVAAARQSLARQAETLADEIVAAILRRRTI